MLWLWAVFFLGLAGSSSTRSDIFEAKVKKSARLATADPAYRIKNKYCVARTCELLSCEVCGARSVTQKPVYCDCCSKCGPLGKPKSTSEGNLVTSLLLTIKNTMKTTNNSTEHFDNLRTTLSSIVKLANKNWLQQIDSNSGVIWEFLGTLLDAYNEKMGKSVGGDIMDTLNEIKEKDPINVMDTNLQLMKTLMRIMYNIDTSLTVDVLHRILTTLKQTLQVPNDQEDETIPLLVQILTQKTPLLVQNKEYSFIDYCFEQLNTYFVKNPPTNSLATQNQNLNVLCRILYDRYKSGDLSPLEEIPESEIILHIAEMMLNNTKISFSKGPYDLLNENYLQTLIAFAKRRPLNNPLINQFFKVFFEDYKDFKGPNTSIYLDQVLNLILTFLYQIDKDPENPLADLKTLSIVYQWLEKKKYDAAIVDRFIDLVDGLVALFYKRVEPQTLQEEEMGTLNKQNLLLQNGIYLLQSKLNDFARCVEKQMTTMIPLSITSRCVLLRKLIYEFLTDLRPDRPLDLDLHLVVSEMENYTDILDPDDDWVNTINYLKSLMPDMTKSNIHSDPYDLNDDKDDPGRILVPDNRGENLVTFPSSDASNGVPISRASELDEDHKQKRQESYQGNNDWDEDGIPRPQDWFNGRPTPDVKRAVGSGEENRNEPAVSNSGNQATSPSSDMSDDQAKLRTGELLRYNGGPYPCAWEDKECWQGQNNWDEDWKKTPFIRFFLGIITDLANVLYNLNFYYMNSGRIPRPQDWFNGRPPPYRKRAVGSGEENRNEPGASDSGNQASSPSSDKSDGQAMFRDMEPRYNTWGPCAWDDRDCWQGQNGWDEDWKKTPFIRFFLGIITDLANVLYNLNFYYMNSGRIPRPSPDGGPWSRKRAADDGAANENKPDDANSRNQANLQTSDRSDGQPNLRDGKLPRNEWRPCKHENDRDCIPWYNQWDEDWKKTPFIQFFLGIITDLANVLYNLNFYYMNSGRIPRPNPDSGPWFGKRAAGDGAENRNEPDAMNTRNPQNFPSSDRSEDQPILRDGKALKRQMRPCEHENDWDCVHWYNQWDEDWKKTPFIRFFLGIITDLTNVLYNLNFYYMNSGRIPRPRPQEWDYYIPRETIKRAVKYEDSIKMEKGNSDARIVEPLGKNWFDDFNFLLVDLFDLGVEKNVSNMEFMSRLTKAFEHSLDVVSKFSNVDYHTNYYYDESSDEEGKNPKPQGGTLPTESEVPNNEFLLELASGLEETNEPQKQKPIAPVQEPFKPLIQRNPVVEQWILQQVPTIYTKNPMVAPQDMRENSSSHPWFSNVLNGITRNFNGWFRRPVEILKMEPVSRLLPFFDEPFRRSLDKLQDQEVLINGLVVNAKSGDKLDESAGDKLGHDGTDTGSMLFYPISNHNKNDK